MKRSLAIELFIITLLGCVYFALHAPPPTTADFAPPVLDLRPIASLLTDTSVRPIGLEHERLAGTILPIRTGLQRYGHIPTWNSLLSNGVPLTNNAFSYFFNPFHSLPVLILGSVTGSKVAMLIALLIAGYSMWTFGLAIGLGAVARVTVALLYLTNGSITAKFGAGHFQLACSLAWPPLVLATLWWTLHTKKRFAPIAVAISFALLFYAGNIYYVLHTGLCCLVIVALHLIDHSQNRWHFRWDRLKRAVIAGAFAFGLSALLFFPVWQTRDFVTHEQQDFNEDGTITNSYSFGQAINNLLIPWQDWSNYKPTTLFDAVDYAYVGNVVAALIILAFVTYVVQRFIFRRQTANLKDYFRAITASIFIAIVMMFWASGQTEPIPWLYTNIPLLAQFRFIGRALAIADLWWILLSGIALDFLWNQLKENITASTTFKSTLNRRLLWASALPTCAWLFLVIYSASIAPDRIAMVMRNVNWWHQLDTLRYTNLPDALRGLILILIVIAFIDLLIRIEQNLLSKVPDTQKFALFSWISHGLKIGLLGGVAFGILNVMTSNMGALQFSAKGIPFDTIYDAIHRVDVSVPFPSVTLPFSPFTFGAYEYEIRVWSLNEGWLPAAPAHTALDVNLFTAFPRWLITERNMDGTFVDPGSTQFIKTVGYESRACYVSQDNTLQLANCAVHQAGFNLYEFPQALPYAFLTSDRDLITYPTTLHANQVEPAEVLLYQQDNIVLHANDSSTDFDNHYLVVQEANFPGWKATIDGVDVPIVTVPTYVIGSQTRGLIAIPTRLGHHTYALRFDPPGLSTGILVFFGTLILIFVYLNYRPKQKSPA